MSKIFAGIKSYLKRFFLIINKRRGKCYLVKPLSMNIDISGSCNLACVMCAEKPRRSGSSAQQNMSLEDFKKVFDALAQAGFDEIHFSPAKGEIFLNKNIWPILHYIESSSVKILSIVTNLIPLDEKDIQGLFSLKKLSILRVSIYGYNLESFKKITQRGQEQFEKFKQNLEILQRVNKDSQRSFKLVLHWWVGDLQEFRESKGEFKDFVLSLGREVDCLQIKKHADNRAGMISSASVAGSGIKVKSPQSRVVKYGPCRNLFTDFIVNTDFSISTCRCYDHAGKLFLGFFNEKPLNHLLSGQNTLFSQLINEQERGIYRDPCTICSQYKSIYSPRRGKCLSYQELKKRYCL